MIDYITYIILLVLILADLMVIFNVLLGNYTSFFVRYFSTVSVDSNQLKKLSKKIQKKYNLLVALEGALNMLITVLTFRFIFSRGNIVVIILFILSLSANSKFFKYRINKLLETN